MVQICHQVMFPPLFSLSTRIDVHSSFLRLIPTSRHLEIFSITVSLSSPTDQITARNKNLRDSVESWHLSIRNGLELSTCLSVDRWLKLFGFLTGVVRLLHTHLQMTSQSLVHCRFSEEQFYQLCL